MRIVVAGLLIVVAGAIPVSAGKLDVAYTSMERLIVKYYLTEGGRRYLRGGPEDTCAYAFIQEPRMSATGGRLSLRFLFAGKAGKQVAGRCVGAGDNFDIIVSGVPRYADGEIFLDDAKFESDHKLFDVFSGLIESQLTPLLRVAAKPELEDYVQRLSSRGAGNVRLTSMDIRSIDLGASSVIVDADFLVAVAP